MPELARLLAMTVAAAAERSRQLGSVTAAAPDSATRH
jgi:hypothetical protein